MNKYRGLFALCPSHLVTFFSFCKIKIAVSFSCFLLILYTDVFFQGIYPGTQVKAAFTNIQLLQMSCTLTTSKTLSTTEHEIPKH